MRCTEAAGHLGARHRPLLGPFCHSLRCRRPRLRTRDRSVTSGSRKISGERGMMQLARIRTLLAFSLCTLLLFGASAAHCQASPASNSGKPTAAEAKAFLDAAEKQILDLGIKAQRAAWVQQNFITVDTEQNSADANEAFTTKNVELSKEAHRFDGLTLSPELARKMTLLKISTLLPSPSDPVKQTELAQIEASLDGDYGRGKWCPDLARENCLD